MNPLRIICWLKGHKLENIPIGQYKNIRLAGGVLSADLSFTADYLKCLRCNKKFPLHPNCDCKLRPHI